jgi:hypothetical protein
VLDCTDGNGDVVFNLSLALTWIAVGELEKTKLNDRYRTPDFASINHFSGSSRSAGASGSVSDGNTNFAPDATDDARISSGKGGVVTIEY